LAGCAIGAAVVFYFGPMLIVFAMFALGTAGILTKEVVSIKRQFRQFPGAAKR
jgi:Na+/H+-translocating membrane pyrophosphatase